MTRRTSLELLIAAGGLGAAFVALTLYVHYAGPIPLDQRAFDYVVGRQPPQALLDLENLFQQLATPVAGALTVIGGATILGLRTGTRAGITLLVSAAIVVLERPLAEWIGRTDAAREVGFVAGNGYPSGHVLYGTVVFGAIAALSSAVEVRVVAGALVIGMAVTRVTAGSHLVDEALGSLLLGGAWLCLVLAVSRRAA